MNMQRISSRQTFFIKRMFPVIWFGIIVIAAVAGLIAMIVAHQAHPWEILVLLLVLLFMAAWGYMFMKKLAFDLMDEVWDAGDALLVKNRGKEERISFSNITGVNAVNYTHPPRVTLTLRQPGIFGARVTFCPGVITFSLSKGNPISDDLSRRVDAAR